MASAPQTIRSLPQDVARAMQLLSPLSYARLDIRSKRAARLGSPSAGTAFLGGMVGSSLEMQSVFAMMRLLASTSVSALLTGESGTGKDIAAQTIHRLSDRRNGPFIAINCAALPETLIESELFGHEKGAFTGAVDRRPGCFELAHGGTLLLDEIAEIPVSSQAKLLRVLENHRVRPLGAKCEIQVDVRVLAATNKDPQIAIHRHSLREDLYYRLCVFDIWLPPLRHRKDDLPDLIAACLRSANTRHGRSVSDVDPAALEALQQHSWPGNVRELRNVIERAVIIAGDGMIMPEHLSFGPRQLIVAVPGFQCEEDANHIMVPIGTTVAEAEYQLVLKTLEYTGFNKARTAKMLGVSLKTLYNKVRVHADCKRTPLTDDCTFAALTPREVKEKTDQIPSQIK
jgi:transcriptional regulator with PAS, ATPase and Fis domain